jgi:hypothetical protein
MCTGRSRVTMLGMPEYRSDGSSKDLNRIRPGQISEDVTQLKAELADHQSEIRQGFAPVMANHETPNGKE